jgi:type I restriction enzyme M protein
LQSSFIQEQLEGLKVGIAQPNLSLSQINSFKIPLPSENEQNKIIAECEAIDQEVSKAENEIVRVKNEISNILINGNFITKNLNQVIHKQSEQIDPNQNTGDVFYVGLENIESNTGNLVGNPLTQYATIKSNKNVFKKGDLLYGKLRPNLNKLYLAKEEGICSTDILVFRCLDEELNKFYAYYLRTKQFNDEVLKTVSGQQLPRTKWSLIETIKVPIPQEHDKNNIIQQIENLEKAIQTEQTKINSAADKKKAVMKKYL